MIRNNQPSIILLFCYADPMFPSENPDLMGSSSDVEGDKSQCGPDATTE